MLNSMTETDLGRKRSAFVVRQHMNLGVDFMLRLVRLLADLFEGDVTLGLVFVAVAQASTQHLRRTPGYIEEIARGLFPDDLRRPISISSLARSLGIPVETTRRHVIKLVDLGYARRSETGGVLVTADILARPEIQALAAVNAANMEQLIEGLRRTPANR
jgi:hypothetical protein